MGDKDGETECGSNVRHYKEELHPLSDSFSG